MEFKYTITAELTSIERMTLALRGEPYYFVRADDGTVKINPDLPAEVLSIGGEMWRIDHLMEEEDTVRIDELRLRLKKICGEVGADQLYLEWNKDLHRKLKEDARMEAREWLEGMNIADELDAISDERGTYNPGLLDALWELSGNVGAIFLYGYLMGTSRGAHIFEGA